jgi:hypothetical protein
VEISEISENHLKAIVGGRQVADRDRVTGWGWKVGEKTQGEERNLTKDSSWRVPVSFFESSAGGDPDLVDDDGHHEDEIEAECPEDCEFGAFQVTPGDGVLLGVGELVVFEGGQDPGLVGG